MKDKENEKQAITWRKYLQMAYLTEDLCVEFTKNISNSSFKKTI